MARVSHIAELEQARRFVEEQSQTIAMHCETIDRLRAELSRKEAVLSSTQAFCAKYKKMAYAKPVTHSDRRAAMDAAKELAMRTGTSQRVLL